MCFEYMYGHIHARDGNVWSARSYTSQEVLVPQTVLSLLDNALSSSHRSEVFGVPFSVDGPDIA